MVVLTNGNIFDSVCEAIVNPVNCYAVMDKGIALSVKNRFPERSRNYEHACSSKNIKPGDVILDETNGNPQNYILHLATKDYYKNQSRMEWIQKGMENLIKVIKENNIGSVAIPALGSGAGGLPWEDVKKVIFNGLANAHKVIIEVYEPRPDLYETKKYR